MINRTENEMVDATPTRNASRPRRSLSCVVALVAFAVITADHAQPARADGIGAARGVAMQLTAIVLAQTEKAAPSQPEQRTTISRVRPRPKPITGPVFIPDPTTKDMQPLVKEAIEKARKSVLDQPTKSSAWTGLGATCDAHGLYDCAEFAYARAFELDPSDYRNPYLQAVVLDVTGREPKKALELYERAYALAPPYPPILWRWAKALERSGRADKALELYFQSTELGQPLAIGHRSAGQLLMSAARHAEAELHLKQSLAIAPGDGATHAALAQLYRRMNKRKLSKLHAAKAKEFEPVVDVPDPLRDKMRSLAVDSATLMFRAKNAIGAGDFASATPLFELCERALPNDSKIQVYLATCYRATDRPDKAITHAKRALTLNPDNLSAILELAAASAIKGEIDNATKYYEHAQRLNPNNVRIDTWMADVFIKASYNNLGILAMERGQRKGEVGAHAHWMWGVALTENDDTYEAIEHFKKAIEANANFTNAYYSLGLAYESLDRLDDAIEQYKLAGALDRNHLAAQRLDMLGIEVP